MKVVNSAWNLAGKQSINSIYASSHDVEIHKLIPAVLPIWHEVIQQLEQLTQTNPHLQYLQAVGKGSLTSILTNKLANLQEIFIDGSVSLKVGEGGRSILPFQIETMPPVGKRLNEDAFLLEKVAKGRKLVAGVIDGATSQKPIQDIAPVTGAFHLSHLAAYCFSRSQTWQSLLQDESLNAAQIMAALNLWLWQQLKDIDGVSYDDVLTIPGAAATIVVIDPTAYIATFAHVADTMLAIEKVSGEIEVLTDNKNEPFDLETGKLVAEIVKERKTGYLQAARDERVKAQLRASFVKKINTKNGCGILNGMPELYTNNLVQEGTFSLKGVKRIILMSDGAYAPWQQVVDKNLRLPREFGQAVDQARAVAHTPLSITGRLLQTDPDAELYHRLKPQDDATFVTLDLL